MRRRDQLFDIKGDKNWKGSGRDMDDYKVTKFFTSKV